MCVILKPGNFTVGMILAGVGEPRPFFMEYSVELEEEVFLYSRWEVEMSLAENKVILKCCLGAGCPGIYIVVNF